MKKYRMFAAILLLSCVSACQPTILPPEPKANDQWTYRFTNYDELGNITGSADISFTATGFDKEVNDNNIEQWANVQPDDDFFTGVPAGSYRLRNDGLYHLTNLSLGGVPTMFIPYPGNVGQASMYHYGNNQVISRTIVSVNDTLTVPYGHFSGLYAYDIENTGELTNRLWFNDSVWIVKYEVLDSLTSDTGIYVQETIELVNYVSH